MSTLTWSLDRVDAAKIKTLALLLADPNPIHFDPEAAEILGTNGRLVNQGPSTIAMVYNLFARELPDHRVKRLEVRLLGSVLESDSVTVEASSLGDASYEVMVHTPDGPKLTGVAHLAVRS